MYLLHNFNHERFVISASTCRFARLCYSESLRLGEGAIRGQGGWLGGGAGKGGGEGSVVFCFV